MLQHNKTFLAISCSQLCGTSLGMDPSWQIMCTGDCTPVSIKTWMIIQHWCLTSQMSFWKNGQKIQHAPKPGGNPFPEELKLLYLQRLSWHHIKPHGLRMWCHSSSYACEGRQANTWHTVSQGNTVSLAYSKFLNNTTYYINTGHLNPFTVVFLVMLRCYYIREFHLQ